MARSVFLRRSLALAGTGMLAGLGLMAAAAPAQADTPAPAPGNTVVVVAPPGDYAGWTWCPYGYYWHHEGLLSGVLDGAGNLLGGLL